MASQTTLISKVAMGHYFGGDVQGYQVESQPVYIDDKFHIQTKVRRNGELVLIETNPSVKAHKEMARAMLKNMKAYIA